jgi:hypothetical protein
MLKEIQKGIHMSLHISHVDKELTKAERAAQGKNPATTQGLQYSLVMNNQSANSWIFYVYQRLPQPTGDGFSLAWFCTPYPIQPKARTRFTWQADYEFSWADTGALVPGVEYRASQTESCNPEGANTTELSMSSAPDLSPAVKNPPSGSLVIRQAANVPNNRLSVGIGMSGAPVYAFQAGPNMMHTVMAVPNYWIAFGTNVRAGMVLDVDTIMSPAEAKFPNGVYDLDCTLNQNNTWTISPA